jgi:hypothetical protein
VTEPLYDLSGLLMLNDVVNKIVEDAKPPFGPDGSIWAGGNETDPSYTGALAVLAKNDRGLVPVTYRLPGMLPKDDLLAASIKPVQPFAVAFITSTSLMQRLRLIMSKIDRLPK